MGTYRKVEREVLRRKVGNKALSECYKKLKAGPKPKKKSLLRRFVDKLIRRLKNAWKRARNI